MSVLGSSISCGAIPITFHSSSNANIECALLLLDLCARFVRKEMQTLTQLHVVGLTNRDKLKVAVSIFCIQN